MGVNATQLLTDDMTLEEKLAAIDQMMADAQASHAAQASANGQVVAPLDPADLTMCEGCQ